MSTFGIICLIGVVFGAGFLLGHMFGWHKGTDDTERRWSDAVNRKDGQYE
jgi:hypothetical protein